MAEESLENECLRKIRNNRDICEPRTLCAWQPDPPPAPTNGQASNGMNLCSSCQTQLPDSRNSQNGNCEQMPQNRNSAQMPQNGNGVQMPQNGNGVPMSGPPRFSAGRNSGQMNSGQAQGQMPCTPCGQANGGKSSSGNARTTQQFMQQGFGPQPPPNGQQFMQPAGFGPQPQQMPGNYYAPQPQQMQFPNQMQPISQFPPNFSPQYGQMPPPGAFPPQGPNFNLQSGQMPLQNGFSQQPGQGQFPGMPFQSQCLNQTMAVQNGGYQPQFNPSQPPLPQSNGGCTCDDSGNGKNEEDICTCDSNGGNDTCGACGK